MQKKEEEEKMTINTTMDELCVAYFIQKRVKGRKGEIKSERLQLIEKS